MIVAARLLHTLKLIGRILILERCDDLAESTPRATSRFFRGSFVPAIVYQVTCTLSDGGTPAQDYWWQVTHLAVDRECLKTVVYPPAPRCVSHFDPTMAATAVLGRILSFCVRVNTCYANGLRRVPCTSTILHLFWQQLTES